MNFNTIGFLRALLLLAPEVLPAGYWSSGSSGPGGAKSNEAIPLPSPGCLAMLIVAVSIMLLMPLAAYLLSNRAAKSLAGLTTEESASEHGSIAASITPTGFFV